MKKTLIVLLSYMVLFLNTSNAQENTFKVYGTIKGLDSDKMMAIITDPTDPTDPNGYRRENIEVKNESFEFTSVVNELTHITISTGVERVIKRTGRGYIPAKSSLLACFVYPGANIEIVGEITDFVNAYPKGDEMNNGLAELNKLIFPVMNEAVNYFVEVSKLEGEKKIEAQKKGNIISAKSIALKEEFIADNPEQLASVWMLSDMAMRNHLPMNRIDELFNSFTSKHFEVSYYKELEERLKGYQTTKNGQLAPNIKSLNTIDGKEFYLTSLRGKYVVIDFWGTWCGPCIQGMPKLREYSIKYKNSLEVLSIAQDRDEKKWKGAVVQNKMDWYNIINNDKKVIDWVLNYNVSGFPTKILIDPKGKIIGRWVGEGEDGEELYHLIDELLLKKN